MNNVHIANSLTNSIWSSLKIAIENNSPETVNTFVVFLRKILRKTLKYKKIETFNQFIIFPDTIYTTIKQQQNKYQLKGEKIFFVADEMSRHISEIITLIGILTKDEPNKLLIIDFYYEAFRSFNDLLYRQTTFHDWEMLASSIKKYRYLTGDFFVDPSSKYRLNILISESDGDENTEEIQKIKADLEVQSQVSTYGRQTLSVLKYWLYLLYDEGIIDIENLLRLLQVVKEVQINDLDKEIKDLFFFRTSNLSQYMGWKHWDFMGRPEMESFRPPMVSNWMTTGFVIDRIRTKNYYFDISEISSNQKMTLPFLYDAVQEDIQKFRKNYEKWQKILLVRNIDEYDRIAKNLLTSIAFAKRVIVSEEEKLLSAANLDDSKIRWFTMQMQNAWKIETRIRKIFNILGEIIEVSDEYPEIKKLEQHNFIENGKKLFTKGDYVNAKNGLDHFASGFGKMENDLFIEIVENCDPVIIHETSLLILLDSALKQMQRNSITTTAIILESEYLYKDEEFFKSDRYTGYYNPIYHDDIINFFVLGEFDGIPIFLVDSPLLKDKVIISNFKKAFLMRHVVNKDWFENELSVEVNKISEELVEEKYFKNPGEWLRTDEGILLSEEDAKIKIRNSITIDFERFVDFEVRDKTQVIVGHITENL